MTSTPPTLITIPTELRLLILEQIFTPNTLIRIHPSRSLSPAQDHTQSLLATNALLRHEALPPFYARPTFSLSNALREADLSRWLAATGPRNLAAIGRLEFHCKARCSMYGLQPDTDYCLRSAVFVKRRGGEEGGKHRLLSETKLCSNDAFGCMERLVVVLAAVEVPRDLNVEDVLALWRALSWDCSSSAA